MCELMAFMVFWTGNKIPFPIQGPVCVGNVRAMMLIPPEIGVTFMGTPVSVTNETADPSMIDTRMTSAQVKPFLMPICT